MRRPARTASAEWRAWRRFGALAICTAALAACEQTGTAAGLGAAPALGAASEAAAPAAPAIDDTDPEIFDMTGTTYWDGRPSLGGVWVAHPLADKPVRARIVNEDTGARVDGALFRRDPTLTGAPIMLSYDAARAIGVEPGVETRLRIVALKDPATLKREAEARAAEIEAEQADLEEAEAAAPAAATLEAPQAKEAAVETQTEEVATAAAAETRSAAPAAPRPPAESAAPAAAETAPAETAAAPRRIAPATPEPEPAATPAAESPAVAPAESETAAATEPPAPEAPATEEAAAPAQDPDAPRFRYIQAGSFRIEANAEAAAAEFRAEGTPARVNTQRSGGGSWSRVLLGPFETRSEMRETMRATKARGYGDAIYVDD